MNANELADCLEMTPTAKRFKEMMLEAATMLRQQQVENILLRNQVEPLRKELIELHQENEVLKSVILALDSSIDNAKACMRMSAEELMELYK